MSTDKDMSAPTPPSLAADENQEIIDDKNHEAEVQASTTTSAVEWPVVGIHQGIDAPISSEEFLSSCMVFVLNGDLAYTMYVGSAGRDSPEQGAVFLRVQSATTGAEISAAIIKSDEAAGELQCQEMDGDVLIARAAKGTTYRVDPVARTLLPMG